jgi:AcrR family transcriptional regulator
MKKNRYGSEFRREQIAEAALDIVRSQGIRALSLAAVAQQVDIVPSAVYRHFKNKGDIVSAALQLIKTRLNDHFREAAQQDLDAVEKLRLLLNRHINLISGNNAIPRIIFSEEVIGGMPQKRRQLYDIIREVIGNVAAIVREGQQEGTIRKDLQAETIAVAFLGIIQPAAVIWSLSAGEFDIVDHSRNAWRLFSDSIRTGKTNQVR